MVSNQRLMGCTGLGLGLAALLLGMGKGHAETLPIANKTADSADCGAIACKNPAPVIQLVQAPLEQEQATQPNLTGSHTANPNVLNTAPASAALLAPHLDHSNVPIAVADTDNSIADNSIDVDPALIESSPVLQRWLEAIPDVATDIKHDPAFRTRIRLGYAHFPSNDHTGGLYVGVQDIFIGRTPLTVSAEYSQNGRGDRTSYGVDAQYYVLPLGSYGNFAPVLGYRHLDTPTYNREGLNVGFRVVLIPSRTGAADLSLTQTWVAPGTDNEVGLTTFSVGYAVTSQLRISTDIQTQNTAIGQDSRVGMLLEWML
jgi:hypothetical protein